MSSQPPRLEWFQNKDYVDSLQQIYPLNVTITQSNLKVQVQIYYYFFFHYQDKIKRRGRMNKENNDINQTRTNLEAPKTALSYLKDQILLNN